MAELLASKIVIQEEEPRFRTVTGVPTGTGAIVGIFERGPIGVATLVTSFAEFFKIFGGDILAGVGTQAVRGFFQNGGQRLYVIRTAHYSNLDLGTLATAAKATLNLQTAATAATAGRVLGTVVGPFALTPGDTLSIDVDGGGVALATFDAAAASRTSGNTETFDLLDGLDLTVAIDGGGVQTVTFNTAEFVDITNATAAEVAAVINAELIGASASVAAGAVVITSDTQGTDSGVNVTGGTANTGGVNRLGFTTGNIAGTGDVADITQVSVAEIKTVVEADVAGLTVNNVGGAVEIVSNTTGPASSILVEAVSTADDELGLDNATHSGTSGAAVDTLQVDAKDYGAYANDITVLISAATSGVAGEFNMSILDGGVIVEVWPNLSMDDAADNYVETLVNDATNGSQWVVVTDLDANAANPDLERPADSPGSPVVPFGPLTGGDDGLAAIDDNDFIGSDAAKNGIRALDQIADASLLFIPDRTTAAVHNAMLTYGEVTRDKSMFCVLDPPAGLDKTGIVSYVETTAALLNLSEFGSIYWPQIKVLNPSTAVFGTDTNITVPPSGHVAGMMARNDGARVGGVYDPPAGVDKGRLLGVTGFETDAVLEEAVRDIIFPKRINPITKLPGQPIAVDGARTLKGNGNFPYVSERRGVIFIEQTLKNGLEFARNKNNDADLRAAVERTIITFLVSQMRVGAFRSTDPNTAFFVDVSDAINPPSEVFAGRLNARIGLATQKPAEFIILSFSQDTRALEEELAAAGA